MNSVALLEKLIAFPTVSVDPNRALIDFCADVLQTAGANVTVIENTNGEKANLYATIGPQDKPGVMLSGHTDVVPVDGQYWTVPPFKLTQAHGKYLGRGTADMKGFVACALAAAVRAGAMELQTPLHLALSYDEEIGCVGVRSLIDMLAEAPMRPRFCIVGEPTMLAVATGHKGKTAGEIVCTGREGHSALAPSALNAIHIACDMVGEIRDLQAELARGPQRDEAFDVPYTTLHVGRMEGGVALNIVPNHARFEFEIRNLLADSPDQILDVMRDRAAARVTALQADFPEASIDVYVTNSYPPLDTPESAEVVTFVKSLTGANATTKVAFGTEGGLFSSKLDVPTVVCGPGSMAQGHKPDEFISADQLERCDAMLDTLLNRLVAGL